MSSRPERPSDDSTARPRRARGLAQELGATKVEHTEEAAFHLQVAAGFSKGPRRSIPRPTGLAPADVAGLLAF